MCVGARSYRKQTNAVPRYALTARALAPTFTAAARMYDDLVSIIWPKMFGVFQELIEMCFLL